MCSSECCIPRLFCLGLVFQLRRISLVCWDWAFSLPELGFGEDCGDPAVLCKIRVYSQSLENDFQRRFQPAPTLGDTV
jgi:hypothetical protein